MPCTTRFVSSRGPYRNVARSLHPGGAQLAFCDGRVEFIQRDIDACLWLALATKAASDETNTELRIEDLRRGSGAICD